MEFHRGRLIDHVHLVVSDLDVSKRFYQAVFQALGLEIGAEGPGFFMRMNCLCPQEKTSPVFILPSRPAARNRWQHFIAPGWQPVAVIMVNRASAPIIPVTMPLICWTRTAIISKRFITGPIRVPPPPSSSLPEIFTKQNAAAEESRSGSQRDEGPLYFMLLRHA